jgi:hypothetical protein
VEVSAAVAEAAVESGVSDADTAAYRARLESRNEERRGTG